jgi:lipid-binding SYLF domain-containing protein
MQNEKCMLNNINNKWLGLLLISLLALTGCATTGGEFAGSATDITRESNAALQDLYATNPEARQLARRAKGVLVFPSIVKAGFLVGAQYGTGGALFKKGRTAVITISYRTTVASRRAIVQLCVVFYG